MRAWWQALTDDERRVKVAARNKDKARARDRERYFRHREERLARTREWTKRNPEKAAASAKRWAAQNPEKRRAQFAVGNAVRDGRLVKEPCEVCGSTERVHGHHDDYARPLDVRWLCPQHHMEQHRRYPVAA